MRDQLNKGENLLTPLKQKKNSFFQGGETRRMKTRKIMASLLAFAMLLSIVAVPVGTADAASNNSVNRVVRVAKDYSFTTSNAVYLRIEEKYAGDLEKTDGEIELSLKNASFTTSAASDLSNFDAREYGKAMRLELTDENYAGYVDAAKTKRFWEIPLLAKVSGEGEVTVTIDQRESFVDPTTHVFAISASGGSVASINKVTKFSSSSTKIESIVIDETSVGSLDKADELKLRLPSSAFTWAVSDWKAVAVADRTPVIKWDGKTLNPNTDYTIEGDDERNLVINFKQTLKGLKNSSNKRATLVIENLYIHADSNAKFGEIPVGISGDEFTSQDLVVAEYQDYGVIVKVKEDKIPELYSGRWGGYPTKDYAKPSVGTTGNNPNDTFKDLIDQRQGATEDENKLQTLVIEENSPGAWLTDRRTRIEFPSDVKIIGVEAKANKFANNSTVEEYIEKLKFGKNYIEFSLDGNTFTKESGQKAKIEFTFYVSVAATFEGDIVANVSGRSLEEAVEVVLGKAVKAVKVEADSVDLRIGVLNQTIGDIVITEVEAGAIIEGQPIKVNLHKDYIKWNKKPTVEVISGDLELNEKEIKTDGHQLIIPVKSDSSKASVIKISGGTVDLNRTVPEGVFKVSVGGTALVQNDKVDDSDVDYGAHIAANVASFEALNVITPAPGEERKTVKFNLDSKEYVVIEAGKEVTKTMDVAPYIENGRALLPIRFVAEALGVSEDNIVWNANTKEVTIFKGDRVAKVQIGSNILVVNGTQVVMDTTAAIKDERTVLPIRFVGQALGANIGWDDATRTITVQQ